jgi:3-hydroxybutyryl-CoA dehydratase
MREGDLLPEIERTVTQERVHAYAAASGDYNPLHVDPEFARTTEFGGTVAHGMMIAATISEMMSAAFNRDWIDGGRLKVRFKAPVLPGETVRTSGRVTAVRDLDEGSEIVCAVEVHKPDGQAAIAGEAAVRVSEER